MSELERIEQQLREIDQILQFWGRTLPSSDAIRAGLVRLHNSVKVPSIIAAELREGLIERRSRLVVSKFNALDKKQAADAQLSRLEEEASAAELSYGKSVALKKQIEQAKIDADAAASAYQTTCDALVAVESELKEVA
jgi:hypothetical protein